MECNQRVELTPEEEERVQRLHRESFVFDALTTSIVDRKYADILKTVGVNATNYTVAATSLSEGKLTQDNFVTTCKKIGNWYRVLQDCSEDVALATSIEEMYEIHQSGRLSIFFGFQNGSPIEDNLDYLEIFYRLGVRFIQLTYNSHNFIGSGSGEQNDAGLSDFGERVVGKMNELGIAVDLSHCSAQTALDAIACSEKPVLFTHANVRALANTPRNRCDEQIRLLAEKGGVIGVKFMLGDTVHKMAKDTTYADVVDHIDYIVNLVGIDHVGLGTDFTGTATESIRQETSRTIEVIRQQFPGRYLGERKGPAGFRSIEELPNITGELVRRGYRDDDIKKILGENWIRVLKVIWNE